MELLEFWQLRINSNAEIDNQKWCVTASALIPSNKTDQFRKELDKELAANEGDMHITVKDSRIFIDEQ